MLCIVNIPEDKLEQLYLALGPVVKEPSPNDHRSNPDSQVREGVLGIPGCYSPPLLEIQEAIFH